MWKRLTLGLLLIGTLSGCEDAPTPSTPAADAFAAGDLGMLGKGYVDGENTGKPGFTSDFGHPCATNEDCEAGLCVETEKGSACTQICHDACPKGWLCPKADGRPDMPSLCQPSFPTLCMPCVKHSDCESKGGPGGARCVTLGPNGSFCASDCAHSESPGGYTCEGDEESGRLC
jgi:hypothetical protein